MKTSEKSTSMNKSLEDKLEELRNQKIIIKPIKVKVKKFNLRFPIDGMF